MSFRSVRDLVLSINLDVYGVPATVTRVAPADTTPIETTAIWLSPSMLEGPLGSDVQVTDSRKVVALPLSQVSSAPRGTTIVMTDGHSGAPARSWRVDSVLHVADDHLRLLVLPV